MFLPSGTTHGADRYLSTDRQTGSITSSKQQTYHISDHNESIDVDANGCMKVAS